MSKIEKFKNFAKRFQWKWNQDTPTEIILPDYQTEEAEKEAEEIENNIENNEIEESLLTNSSIIFTNKRNPRLVITIQLDPKRRISEIENKTGIRFPFSVGQPLNRNIEVWACNNNFLMDGKDTCPEKKIFGVRASDVPQGHEWRHIFPNKFK
jgi:hypothetical protein